MVQSTSYVAACAFALSALALPSPAAADPIVIDQQNLGPRIGGTGVAGDMSLAQTFTVGITGNLTELELGVFNPNDVGSGDPYFPDPLTIELRDTASGAPGTNVLYSWTLPMADATLDRDALTAFAGANLSVVAGQTLAIVFRTGPSGNFGWSEACCYARGTSFVDTGAGFDPIYPAHSGIDSDFIFRTSVEPNGVSPTPEPAAFLLLGTGLAAVFRKSRRMRTAAEF
jgi:hypothetical protein